MHLAGISGREIAIRGWDWMDGGNLFWM
jgi:hypothetical protein